MLLQLLSQRANELQSSASSVAVLRFCGAEFGRPDPPAQVLLAGDPDAGPDVEVRGSSRETDLLARLQTQQVSWFFSVLLSALPPSMASYQQLTGERPGSHAMRQPLPCCYFTWSPAKRIQMICRLPDSGQPANRCRCSK